MDFEARDDAVRLDVEQPHSSHETRLMGSASQQTADEEPFDLWEDAIQHAIEEYLTGEL